MRDNRHRPFTFGNPAAMGASAPIVPISLIAHISGQSGGDGAGFTTAAIDTSGASLIVISLAYLAAASPTVSDSKNNTWTALTAYSTQATSGSVRLYYCKNPTVEANHTFSVAGASLYAPMFVAAFNHTNTSQNADGDVGHGSAAGVTTIQPGSLTPSQNNGLVVTGCLSASGGGDVLSVNGGFTITDQLGNGTNFGGGLAYLVQTTAASSNPTWTKTGAAARMSAAQTSFFLA